MGTRLYPLPVGDGDEFFMRGCVWDSETRPRRTPLPSLVKVFELIATK